MNTQRKLVKVSGLVSRPHDAPPFRKVNADALLGTELDQTNPSLPSSETVALMYVDIRLLDDSPDQYRLVYPKDEIEELAMLLKAGQITPIRIRSKPSGRYEIIAGHRRVRAAPVAGLSKLAAVVVDVDDVRAAIELMVDNEAAESVGDYERANGYQNLIGKGLNQNEVAESMGIGKSLVAMRLNFLKLPSPVIDALKEYPRAYSHTTVSKLLPLLKEFPDLALQAADGTRRVGSGEWSAQTFVAQLFQQQKKLHAPPESNNTDGFAITDTDSRPVLTMKSKPKGRVEIQLAQGVDQAQFMIRLNQLLREEAAKADSQIRIQGHDA